MIVAFGPAGRWRRVVILTVVAVLVALTEVGQHPISALGVALSVTMLTGWMGMVVQRRNPVWLVLMGGSALALEGLGYTPASVALVTSLVFTLIYLGMLVPAWGVVPAAAAVAAFVVMDRLQSPDEAVSISLLNAIGLSAAYGVSVGFHRLQQEQARTRAALEELQAARQGQLEAARSEERARLAREIHDVLAHTLSALSVQVEGAKLMSETHPGEPRAIEALDRAHRLAQEGLREVRRAVGALRGDGIPGPDGLPDLVHDFEADSGIACRLEVEGEPVHLGPEAGLAIYRTAQEALTNVRRHAEASGVTLHLRYLPGGGAELEVEDRGRPKLSTSSGGYGLVGIRERAELLGGSLEAGPVPDGFRVRLRVPA